MAKTPSKKSNAVGKAILGKQARAFSQAFNNPSKAKAKTANQANAAKVEKTTTSVNPATVQARQANILRKAMQATKAPQPVVDSTPLTKQQKARIKAALKAAEKEQKARMKKKSPATPVKAVPGTRSTKTTRAGDTSKPTLVKDVPMKGARVISQKEAQAIALAEAQKKKQIDAKTKKAEAAATKKAAAVAKKNAKKNPVAAPAPKPTKRKTRSPLGGLKRLRRRGLSRRLRRTK